MANGQEPSLVPSYYKFITFLLTGILVAALGAAWAFGNRLGSDRAQLFQISHRVEMLEDRQRETATVIVSLRIDQAKISAQLDRLEQELQAHAK